MFLYLEFMALPSIYICCVFIKQTQACIIFRQTSLDSLPMHALMKNTSLHFIQGSHTHNMWYFVVEIIQMATS